MYEYSCTVERVVDGDTIDVILDLGFDILYKSRVRLYGIDTPESRTRDLDEKARGKMASAFLKEAIENGDKIVIQTKLKDSRGKFGRVLGDVVVDEENINQSMIDANLAVAYYGQSKNEVEQEHLENRRILIEKGLFEPVE
jgi:micrococcal nuclease|tara:strand:+ start:2663 stop:3085 length:423 start_codon:yes stop_codon:yes gene_type:complete